MLERTQGNDGELQLQRRGEDFELIYNGVFLMATYNGAGEKEMVQAALRPWQAGYEGEEKASTFPRKEKQQQLQLLIGGLGFGLSLQEALRSPLVARVDILELEEAVIRWNRGILREVNGSALLDPRVRVCREDLVQLLQQPQHLQSSPEPNYCVPDDATKSKKQDPSAYHAIILDTDNGPGWLSREANNFLYTATGTALLQERLLPGGVLTVWSASPVPAYYALLQQHFSVVREIAVKEKTGQSSFFYFAANWQQPFTVDL